MTNEELIKLIGSLPSEARREVEDYIGLLRARFASREASAENFEDEGFFGIWRDRDKMMDSTAWVRSVREKHWAN